MTDQLWLSVSEIAVRSNRSKVTVLNRAKQEAWPSKRRAGRGGGRVYLWSEELMPKRAAVKSNVATSGFSAREKLMLAVIDALVLLVRHE